MSHLTFIAMFVNIATPSLNQDTTYMHIYYTEKLSTQ